MDFSASSLAIAFNAVDVDVPGMYCLAMSLTNMHMFHEEPPPEANELQTSPLGLFINCKSYLNSNYFPLLISRKYHAFSLACHHHTTPNYLSPPPNSKQHNSGHKPAQHSPHSRSLRLRSTSTSGAGDAARERAGG